MDIFERLKNALECQYISDLKKEPTKTIVKRVMMHISLDGYDIEMLSDLAEYLYDEKIEFETLEQARDFFKKIS